MVESTNMELGPEDQKVRLHNLVAIRREMLLVNHAITALENTVRTKNQSAIARQIEVDPDSADRGRLSRRRPVVPIGGARKGGSADGVTGQVEGHDPGRMVIFL